MRKHSFGTISFAKKICQLNKKALAQKDVVNLDDYRAVSQQDHSRTILLVDEDRVSLNAMKRIFEGGGYRVFIAKDAMEVSKIIDNIMFDLILIEAQLPWVNGYELCSLLKSTPYLKSLPVALMSSNNTEEDIRRGFEAGCDEYILKPFHTEELQQVVEKLLS